MHEKTLPNPILVGRRSELQELKQFLDLALEGNGTTVFISGEAGSGKTRLITEFLNTIKREVTILYGWCLSNAALPYFPFVEAFSSGPSGKEGRSLVGQRLSTRTWLSEVYPTSKLEKNQTPTPQVWKDQAFSSVTRELLFMSSVKPLILVLEDMHWADSASLALLHYISRAIANEKILVLVTYRSEELGTDTEGHPHPLLETVQLMSREGLFKEIRLSNLELDDVQKIAESMLRGTVNLKLIEKLLEESHGNPLFVVEFLRMLSEQGSLVLDKNQWRLSVDKLGMPSKVRDIILRRIGALKPGQRRVLDVASVIGDRFNPDLISGALSIDRLEILEELNNILQSTSLVRIEKKFYKFDNAKSREVLYDKLSLPLKQGYHQRIAEQIEKLSQNGKEVSFNDLAYHYAQAGNKEKSVKYSLAAGQDALARFSNMEAIKHFKYVLESLSNHDGMTTVERISALEGLGDAYYANCMFEDSIKTFERLSKSEIGAIKLRAYRKAMDAAWLEYDPPRLLRLVKKAEKYADSDRLERARFLRIKGQALIRLGDYKAALRNLEEGLLISEEEYSLLDMAQLRGITGGTRILCGLNDKKGLGEQQLGISLRQELGDIRGELIDKVYRNHYLVSRKLFQEMANEYNKMIEIGEKIGDFASLAETTTLLSNLVEESGKFEEAIALTLKALEYSGKMDAERMEPEIYANLARRYARIGDLKKANHYFGELMKVPSKFLLFPRNAPWVALTEAVLFAANSQWKEANQKFQLAFDLSKKGMWKYLNLESSSVFRNNYIWALELQGRFEEAETQRKWIQERTAKIVERFAHADLQADLIMRKRIIMDEENELRLDLVNVGRASGSNIKIKGLIPSDEFKVTAFPSYCRLQNGDLEMGRREICGFQVETIKLTVKAVKAGVFSLNPWVVYVDDLDETKTCKPQPIKIIVSPKIASPREKMVVETKPVKLVFKSEAAHKTFDFLVKAFVEDYFRKRLPKERSGWRTLMDIVKKANVSRYSMYGSCDHRGFATKELEKLGVVDLRFFFGERGRGGKILKLRVSVEKDDVKRYIDQRV